MCENFYTTIKDYYCLSLEISFLLLLISKCSPLAYSILLVTPLHKGSLNVHLDCWGSIVHISSHMKFLYIEISIFILKKNINFDI